MTAASPRPCAFAYGDGIGAVFKGGPLTLADIESRKDMQDLLSEIMYDSAGEDNVPLEPRTKLSYDLHGLLSHVYYENLNNPGEYSLDPASSGRTDITGGA